MKSKRFVVPLADLDYGPKEVDWELPRDWISAQLVQTEAAPRGPGRARLTLTKNGREVVVRGDVEAPLTMPCARSLEPTDVDVQGEVFLLLSPAPAAKPPAAGSRRSSRPRSRGRDARPRRDDAEEADSSETDAAEDTYVNDEVTLDGYLREFILLELPMFPLRSEKTAAISLAPRERPGDLPALDPRLAPLAALKRRLENGKE